MVSVSTIIPCYNHGAVLGRAVESVYAQAGDLDLDVVVVDDGSTDSTPEVCARLSRAFPSLRVLRRTNGGLSSARNAGIAAARGDFVHFLDSDDYIQPTMYTRMISALDTPGSPADIAYCGYTVVDPQGNLKSTTDGEAAPADMRERLLVGCLGPPHSLLLRREAVAAVGQFDTALTSCEDWDYWLRLALAGHRFVHVPGALVFYELGAGNMSRNYPRMVQNAEAVLNKARLNLPDPHLRIHLERGFRQIRACMFAISYSERMRLDLECGRFIAAGRQLLAVMRNDPRSIWPAIVSLMHHKRAITLGIGRLMSRPFQRLNGRPR